jgi:hypothetical protein
MNRSCVYCRKAADTRDHVPPKLIYKKPFPKNLATVPSCSACNATWSMDEQYLKLALSFMDCNFELDAMHDEDGFTNKTLSHPEACGLDDAILNSIGVDELGKPFLAPNMQRLHRVLEKTALGLCELRGWQTTGVSFTTVCFDRFSELPSGRTNAGGHSAIFVLSQRTWNVVQHNVFEYALYRLTNDAQGSAYCALHFYDSITAIVALSNLRNEDWSGALVLVSNIVADI